MGMTTQEVANACGSTPRQAVHAVTADGERQEWSYKEAYLVFANGKLASKSYNEVRWASLLGFMVLPPSCLSIGSATDTTIRLRL